MVRTLSDGLFHNFLQNDVIYNSMNVTAELKRCVVNDESSMLWHWRLGHISIEIMKKLVNEGVLSTLNFADFETCVHWESKLISLKRVQRGEQIYYRLYILTFVVLTWMQMV